ncbi:MAG: hypothetical protein KF787_05425 [Phycisphaeraceae bacterium]|nr:hypothetical protein [Phycisphaerae bacterium]MBX3392071.1 hypothetical protein [Phycisphaeraceae bacterium]HRJ48917.1 GC-type dockerin domain-anchored protein [Phycisphaerales bacterium]
MMKNRGTGGVRGVEITAAVLVTAAVSGLAAPALAHDMMFVGRTSTGKLTIFIEDGILPNMMVPSIFPEYPGWIQPEFGFETIGEDVPEYNLYTISSQSNVVLKLVASDPGVYLQKPQFAGPLGIGETYTFGNPYFHLHPIWTIDDVEIGRVYAMTFVLQDTSGQYADSNPFTLTFGCTPCPADFDLSAFVDLDDFIEFVAAFIDGDDRADFDGSGFVDTDDFDAFVRAFEAGC